MTKTAYRRALGLTTWYPRAIAEQMTAEQQAMQHTAVAADIPISHTAKKDAESAQQTVVVPDYAAADTLDMLEKTVASCTRCGLSDLRTNTVFSSGNPASDIFIVGEAPGEQEDKQGEPFVGRAGKLLDAILSAFSLDRKTVYIANVVKCRPPSNRNPTGEETAHCAPFLQQQIRLVQPKIIVTIGRIAAQHLLQSDVAVGRLRERVHRLPQTGMPVVVSYHPAYLLRKPSEKSKAFRDWRLALHTLAQVRSEQAAV